jgi:hypothetical protein
MVFLIYTWKLPRDKLSLRRNIIMKSLKNNEIALFEKKQVRSVRFQDEWWFVIKDVVSILTESKDPSQYLKRLRSRDGALNHVFKGGVQFVPPLGLEFDMQGMLEKMLRKN